jgi:uracil-DNA glycosylase
MTINEYFRDWSKVIDLNEADRLMKKLAASKESVCPQTADIFKAFRMCPLGNLRVVILGMYPYNNIIGGIPVATGIAFANRKETPEEYYSPSLAVLKESVIDYTVPHGNIIFDPSLEKWEKQGVLLLNASLSCEVGKAGSHTLLWRPFMTSLLTKLSTCLPGTVYVLMGTSAWSLEP